MSTAIRVGIYVATAAAGFTAGIFSKRIKNSFKKKEDKS